jgi:hypothetical protein
MYNVKSELSALIIYDDRIYTETVTDVAVKE